MNLFILLFVGAFNLHAKSNGIDLFLKARGLQAQEKVAKLTKKSNLSDSEMCELLLENAYQTFSNPDLMDITKKSLKGGTGYRIILLDKSKEVGIQFNYVYGENLDKAPLYFEIVTLKTDWQVSMMAKVANMIAIKSSNCFYIASTTNPLEITSEKSAK